MASIPAKPGKTLSGNLDSPWPEAPFKAPAQLPLALDRRLVRGPMAAFLSEQIAPEALFDADLHDSPASVDAVVAYHVEPLVGASLTVESAQELAQAIATMLARHLPGLDWWVPQEWHLPFEKYGIVHNSLPAPPHPETGQPMALELFGTGARAADGTYVVTLAAATYANVKYPGIGVTLYL